MSVGTDLVARRYLNPVAGVAIPVDFPATDKAQIKVLIGFVGTEAVQDTDYTVTLNSPTYEDFVVTPTTALRTKIDAMLASFPTESDQIVVRREINYLSDMTEALAFFRAKIAIEFDKTVFRDQQLQEKIGRCLSLAETDVTGTGSTVLSARATKAGKALIFDADENLTVSEDDYADQAAAAAAAVVLAEQAASDAADALAALAGVISAAMQPVVEAADLATARTAFGLGALAVLSSVNNANWSGAALAIGNGGTGATTAGAALDALYAGAGTGNLRRTGEGAWSTEAVRIITTGTTDSVLSSDCYIAWNSSTASPKTETVGAPSWSQTLTFKDAKGDAATNNITLNASGCTIDGQASFVINMNYAAITLKWDGASNWMVC